MLARFSTFESGTGVGIYSASISGDVGVGRGLVASSAETMATMVDVLPVPGGPYKAGVSSDMTCHSKHEPEQHLSLSFPRKR